MLDSKVPKTKWPEVATAAANIINILPTKSNPNNATPYELWHSRKPTVNYVHVFGCVAYQHIPKETRQRIHDDQKFESRAWKLINLGSSAKTGYILFNPVNGKHTNSRDVIFIEDKNYMDWQCEHKFECQNLLSDHDYALALIANVNQQLKIDDCIPNSYTEAIHCTFSNDWIAAISAEFHSIEHQNAWQLVDRKEDMNIVDTKWVFTCKYNDQNHATPKARLVARRYKDRNHYNSFEMYAPVAPITALHWLLSISQKYGLHLTQLDVRSAFITSSLHEDIFIRIPKGFPHPYECM